MTCRERASDSACHKLPMPPGPSPCDFACPRCAALLPEAASDSIVCAACGSAYAIQGGLYRFLLPERWDELQPFLEQYRQVRQQDGYRTRTPADYNSLPWLDARHPDAGIWQVRAQSFAYVRRLRPATKRDGLLILDLGAGNGWLSNRLSALGQRCVAVDCLDDAEDGLGAYKHYSTVFARVQADFDDLPFAPAQFDLVVFNASLHYAPDVLKTLRHACRVLAAHGRLVVMDSPTFRSNESGRQMLIEQQQQFRARFGLSDILQPGVGYLTKAMLIGAAHQLGLSTRFVASRGQAGWAVRRLLAGIRRRREIGRASCRERV